MDLFSIQTFLLIPGGLLVGFGLGVLPGFAGGTGIAITMPIALAMEPLNAMVFLVNLYGGAVYGGGIPAITLGVPGTAGAAATVDDGYAMAEKGNIVEALSMQATASGIGALFSVICFLLFAPVLARAALRFGPPEFFLLTVFGLTILASLDPKRLYKGLLAGAFGIMLGTIGMDPVWGRSRMNLGFVHLYDNLDYIPVLLGLFAVARMMVLIGKQGTVSKSSKFKQPSIKLIVKSMLKVFKYPGSLIRGSVIGTLVGTLPGAGASIASFIAYTQAKNSSKNPELFGTGIPEGIITPESANNATKGGALIPTFALGIPGSGATAMLMGVMMFMGLSPGPALFIEQYPLIRTLGISLLIGSILIAFLGAFLAAKLLSRITIVPINILAPLVIVTASLGAFTSGYSVFNMYIMLAIGALGFVLYKCDYPVTATVLGIILGPMAEDHFSRSLRMSRGNYSIFFTRPIAVVLWILIILSLLLPKIIKMRQNKLKNSGGAKQ